jgi:hypothetical protein
MPEQNHRPGRHGSLPLTRRLSLRLRCARPGGGSGHRSENQLQQTQLRNGLQRWQRAARLGEPSSDVKRRDLSPTLEPRQRKRRDSHRGQVDKFPREVE